MPANAIPAAGTILAVDETGSSTYTVIGQVKSIKGAGGGEVGQRDATTLASTVKVTLPAILDPGELTFELNYDPLDAVHEFLIDEADSPPTSGSRNWKVTWATTGPPTVVMPGFVQSIDGPDADSVEDNLTMSVTVKRNGVSTRDDGTP